jgi:hypothetical protein
MDVKNLNKPFDDKRVINKLINKIIDINLERTYYKRFEEVECFLFNKIYTINNFENNINFINEKHSDTTNNEIKDCETYIFQEIKIFDFDEDILSRILSSGRKLRTLEKQLKKI